MSFNLTILVKCIVICLCAGLIGFKLGYSSRPRPAGLIEIEKDNTGEIMTTFKLEHGADWLDRPTGHHPVQGLQSGKPDPGTIRRTEQINDIVKRNQERFCSPGSALF